MSDVRDATQNAERAHAKHLERLHVDRLTPAIAVDAMAIGTRVGTIVRLLDDAAAHRAHRRHTNASSLEQLARSELKVLAGELQQHFLRFAELPK